MPYKDKNDPRYKEARTRWYRNNKDKHLANAKARKIQKREYIRQVKNVPCMDCGKKYPYYVMEFDHRKGELKFKDVASMVVEGFDRIKIEIAKCDVVCANCHRVRTFQRKFISPSLS